ncbi:hypothetical protein [Streptomyces niveus]|uniref:hypothetical protein n=1 Tax=Streptomyces niveus TaxID=193462 RepID=UPI0003C5DE8E|nr:hypothetical protein [Streptomyces niveus]EST22420.1 hypothetical protein M877_30020 [Streptomyces niveus NCIMB 11891]
MTYDAKEHGEGERAIRSERGSKPVTPVVPLSEAESAGAGAGGDAGTRPARPTAPPPTPPLTASATGTASARETAPGRAPEATPAQAPRLIPQDECDKLNLRLQEALSTFIDGPRRSVEEAADVLEDAAKRLTAALAERPRALRDSWDAHGGGSGGPTADTEDLRLVLRSYREVTERLLRI